MFIWAPNQSSLKNSLSGTVEFSKNHSQTWPKLHFKGLQCITVATRIATVHSSVQHQFTVTVHTRGQFSSKSSVQFDRSLHFKFNQSESSHAVQFSSVQFSHRDAQPLGNSTTLNTFLQSEWASKQYFQLLFIDLKHPMAYPSQDICEKEVTFAVLRAEPPVGWLGQVACTRLA